MSAAPREERRVGVVMPQGNGREYSSYNDAVKERNAQRWQSIERLYLAAQAIEPGRRSAFLAKECADELELRAEVESLLRYADQPEPGLALKQTGDCSDPSLQAGSLLAGRFRIERLLGAGGMGEVYEASDSTLGGRVALKVIRPGILAHEEAMKRFKREVQSAKKIAHPNVCRIHDLHGDDSRTEGGVTFLTMELLEGETLRARLEQGGLPLDDARTVAEQMCSALEAAHEAGVVHCDFKSDNVMLTRTKEGKLRTVVTDFGLARPPAEESVSGAASGTSQIIGTPAYMAPEQLLGQPISKAVDIYALGVVLFETVTGAQPFTGDSAFAVAAQRLSTPAPRPSEKLPSLPRAWDTAILGCLEYFPSKRFGNATEVWKTICGQHVRARRTFLRAAAAALLIATVCAVLLWRHYGLARSNSPLYLAVLPLQTNPADEKLRYRSDGVADALLARLGELPAVHLASRTAVEKIGSEPANKAAQRLGVNLLVTGTLESAGEDGPISISLRLEDAPKQEVLWQDKVSGSAWDLLRLEDQLSDGLVRALHTPKGQAATPHPTENLEAYDLYLRGRELVKQKRDEATVKAAIDLYTSALAKDSHFGRAHAGLADAAMLMYDLRKDNFWLEKALHEGAEAVRWDGNAVESHVAMGSAYRATGKTGQAIAEFKHALDLSPNSDEALRRLASAYSDAGNKSEAIRYYRKAIEANPFYWVNYEILGFTLFTSGDYGQALENFRRVTEIAPDIANGYDDLAAIYFHQGAYQAAIDQLLKAVQYNPSAQVYLNLSACYYNLGQYAKAIEAGEKSIQLTPNDDLAVSNLADAYRRAGQPNKAAEGYTRAIQLEYAALRANPRDANVMGQMALCYAKLGRFSQATEFIQKARHADTSDLELVFTQAVIEFFKGDQKAALRDLNDAVHKGYSVEQIESEPDLSELRQTAGYRAASAGWPKSGQ